MADLAHAAENDTDLHGDQDAMHWAERFASKFEVLYKDVTKRNTIDVTGLMLAWFAGAIETGRMYNQDMGPIESPPCDHHWVSEHKPDHLLYWVKICSVCHEPDWGDLDSQIESLTALMNRSVIAYKIFDDLYDPADVTIIRTSNLHLLRTGNLKKEKSVEENFQTIARTIVMNYFNAHKDVTDEYEMTFADTYVVWFSKTLQNWKALVSTNVPDGVYYEVTHDGDSDLTYLDVYKKHENVVIRNEDAIVVTSEIEQVADSENITPKEETTTNPWKVGGARL
jgi:hypothetical protein